MHVPGSVNIELDAMFGTYVGWVTPFNAPLVLLLPEPVPSVLTEAVTQLIRIGYERVIGYAAGGLDAWQSGGRQVRSYPTADVDDLCHAYLSGQPMQVLETVLGFLSVWSRGAVCPSGWRDAIRLAADKAREVIGEQYEIDD